VDSVIKRYLEVGRDLLTSVKKTEDSLLKLNLGRRSALNVTGGMSDDNKIRLQLSLDIEVFLAQVATLGVCAENPLVMELDGLRKSAKALTKSPTS
jgi:hypothetical protein